MVVAAPSGASPALVQEPPPPQQQPDPWGDDLPDDRAHAPYFPINLAMLYPFATNPGIPELRTNVALAVMLGRVGYVEGVQLGAINSLVHDLRGVQLGAASLIDGRAWGVQGGGVFAFTDGPLRGAQIAGLLSWSGSSLAGLQIAGGANQARNQVRGVQIAGAFNLTYGDVEGVQIGGVNIGKVRGLQLGVVNVSADTSGTQIGVINIARRASGLQVGVLNITDDLQGESLGVASVPRVGGVHVVAWGSNSLAGNLGVKFASKFTYSILSGALDHQDKDTVYGAGLTLGVRAPVLQKLIDGFTLGGDIGGYRLFRNPSPNTRHDELYKTRIVIEYEIARHFSIFVGGGAYLTIRDKDALSSSVDKSASTAHFGPELSAGLDL